MPQAPVAATSCLPAYPSIRDHTPATVWLPKEADPCAGYGCSAALRRAARDRQRLREVAQTQVGRGLLHPLGRRSRRGGARNRSLLGSLGDDLQGRLVFRAFEPFRTTGTHPQSGMPLVIEYRAVIFDRLLLCVTLYWEAPVAAVSLDLMPFAEMIAGIRSRFFTLDLAQHTDGRWRIIELGDAKVAGSLRERM
ncbi:MAG: ATP-grasp domain-containing protein [Oscillochloris sp.]|nr:ATP-grasp domain-containing protein [Oscillochloris sp.]